MEDTTQVFVKTHFSQMQLERSAGTDVWSFPTNQIRAVPLIVAHTHLDASKFSAYLTTAPDPNFERPTSPSWVAIRTTFAAGEHRFDTSSQGDSMILSSIGRSAVNWRGDLRLLFLALLRPVTHVGLLWLLACGFLWFRGAMLKANSTQSSSPSTKRQPQGHIAGLDQMRGIAILMVITFHFLYATFHYGALGWNGVFPNLNHSATFLLVSPLTFGFGGVGLFFAISGFCIHLSYEKTKVQGWGAFFRRRFFRIYPTYLIALVVFAFFYPPTRYTLTSLANFKQFYSEVFLCFNLHPSTRWPVNGSFWSVAVEMQLYLLFPFVYWLSRQLGWSTVLTLCFVSETAAIWSGWLFDAEPPFWITNGPFHYLFSWTIGAKLADDYIHNRPLCLHWVPLPFWLALLTLSLTFKPLSEIHFMCFSLTGVALIARLITEQLVWDSQSRFGRHLAWLGVSSYSLYLFHQPILDTVAGTIVRLSDHTAFKYQLGLIGCVAAYPLILAVGWFSYRYLELPSIAAGKWTNSRVRQCSTALR